MTRPALEVADIFRTCGAQYRKVHGTSMSREQYRVMRAIQYCRTAFLGGHIDVAFNSIGELLGHNKSGTIRILGVMDEQESGFLPGVKTLAAQGYKAQPIGSDIGLSSPAGLPKEIVDLLTNSVRKAMGDENFKKKMAEQGNTVRYLSPQDYAAHWDRVDARFKSLIEIAKQQPE